MDLAELERAVAAIDRLLEPIAKSPVDTSDPGWVEKMRLAPDPVDQVGARAEAHAALDALLTAYSEGDAETRAAVREIFHRYTSFRWAVHPQGPRDTAEGFRRYVLHWSAVDQGSDTRDELLGLRDACQSAATAGVEIGPILAEVAEISSDVNHYGMGSIRQLLLNRSR